MSFFSLSTARKSSVFLAIGVVSALVILAITFSLRRGGPTQEVAVSAAAAPAPDTFKLTAAQWDSLAWATVTTQPFRSEIVTDGNIATNDNAVVNVFSPFSGRVAKVSVHLGDVVRSGETLMEVDASEFVQGQSDLIAALTAVNTTTTQAHLAEKTENRQHELFLAKAAAQKDWLQSQSDLTAAQNAMRAAEVGLAAVRNRLRILGKSEAEIAALEHSTGVARAGMSALVKAPIGGTVVQRQVGTGQYIQSAAGGAATPSFVLADLSSLWIVANLREADAGNARIGQNVEVKVPAFPERVFKARLAWVSPLVDPVTHRVPVRAEIDNHDRALKPQMLAIVTIATSGTTPTLAVPRNAVVYEGSSARVFVARPDHTVQARQIEVGRQSGDAIEIRSGITANESVVTGGALFIDRALRGSGA